MRHMLRFLCVVFVCAPAYAIDAVPNPGVSYRQAYGLASSVAPKGVDVKLISIDGALATPFQGSFAYRFAVGQKAVYVDVGDSHRGLDGRAVPKLTVYPRGPATAPENIGSNFSKPEAYASVARVAPAAALKRARQANPQLQQLTSFTQSFERDSDGNLRLLYRFFDGAGNKGVVDASTGRTVRP